MDKKKSFKPVITKIALDPEQAVLTCTCWLSGYIPRTGTANRAANVCTSRARTTAAYSRTTTSGGRC
jgi:hypothetical protein